MQSAFERFASLAHPDEIDNKRAYLYKVSSNLALDLLRSKKVRDRYVQDETGLSDEQGEWGPEQAADCRQRLSILARALWAMPGKRRTLLMMSRFDGLSYAEIARRVGLSETVVRKHIAKALDDCYAAMDETGVKQPRKPYS